MKVRLAYGAGGLEVELPQDRTTVVEPAYHEGAPDQLDVLRRALQEPVAGPPLRELAARGPFTHVRLNIFPDGGVARLRIFGTLA